MTSVFVFVVAIVLDLESGEEAVVLSAYFIASSKEKVIDFTNANLSVGPHKVRVPWGTPMLHVRYSDLTLLPLSSTQCERLFR